LIKTLSTHFADDPEVLNLLLQRDDVASHPEWIEPWISSGQPEVDRVIVSKVLSQPQWKNQVDWLKTIVKGNRLDVQTYQALLQEPHWRDHPELRKMCGGAVPTVNCLEKWKPGFSTCILSRIQRLISF
jgi:hypothetical protein